MMTIMNFDWDFALFHFFNTIMLCIIKVTVKDRGMCYNKSSPGKTTEPIDIKQIEDEYKMNDL